MAVLEEPIRETRVIKNYVDGEWVESKGRTVDVVNPAVGRTIARVPLSTGDEFDAAVQAASNAFQDWRATPPLARSRYLFRLKHLLEEHFEELSRIQTQEHGKTIDESRGETRRGIENVEVACGIATMMQGLYSEDVAAGIDEYLIRQPLGVFGVIAPFNFPFMIPLWSIPYAIATGNCVVLKPSSEVPLTSWRVAELAEEAGIPPGVWNIVNGGREIVNAMLEHPGIAGVTFVGSTPTARLVYEKCGATRKRVIAQGGAKNFMVIMPDCNVDRTVPALMTSFFGNAGQRCLAGANLMVVGDDDAFYRHFVDRVTDMAAQMVIGYGLDESVQMGPVRDPEKKQRIMQYIESGVREGATLRLDGREEFHLTDGYPRTCFLGPTIFEQVRPAMRIGSEEIFGPVMSVMRAATLDEAIAVVNASPYGNGHAIFTTSGESARQFRYRVVSGNVGINVGIVAPMAFFPFSGMKDSFFGVLHTQGQEAVRFFTESKVVIERWL
jgi:malonate-semialdehyde dehydrogenase (acetylating)/methylmalonate-semialdehyde dehydrogenase